MTPVGLARLAVRALTSKPTPAVQLTHLHGSRVSVVEQTDRLPELLADRGQATFRSPSSPAATA